MEPPKRIWVDEPDVFYKPYTDDEIEYVRADIVEDIVDKIKDNLWELCRYADDSNDCQYGTLSASLVREIAQEALNRLDGEI